MYHHLPFFFGMSTHIFEDSLSAQQRTPVSAHLGLVFVSACKGLLFFACIQRETKQQQKKRGRKKTHKKQERERERRERERERDDFLVLCDHEEDGDGWDDREE